MKFFDSHAHYNDEKFNSDRDLVIQDIYNSGVTKIISAGYNLDSSISGIKLAKKYPFIYTTIGISPNDLNENWKEDIKSLEELSSKINIDEVTPERKDKNPNENGKGIINKLLKNKIVAIGEIGLDYHYDTDKQWQREAFITQINLANKYDLPIVIHTREAVMDTLNILKEHQVKRKGVFHCCPFNRELVKEGLKLGFNISIAGPVTFKNSANAEEIIKMIPIEKMFIETDSPYLAPEPVRGTRNDSRNLKYIVQKIADFKNISEEEVSKATYENAEKFYNI